MSWLHNQLRRLREAVGVPPDWLKAYLHSSPPRRRPRGHGDQLTGAICLGHRPAVEHYLEVVDQFSGEALTQDASRNFIGHVA